MDRESLIEKLDKLIDVGIALSAQQDNEFLLEKILLSAKSITNADGGTLYLVEQTNMPIAIIHSDSLQMHFGGSSAQQVNFPPLLLYQENGEPNLRNIACYSYHKKSSVNIEDIYQAAGDFDFSGPREFDRRHGYRTKSLLTIPLKNHQGAVIGVLQLINARCPESSVVCSFDELSQKITFAMASQAAIVLTQQQLINDLESLFQSLVKLIATAIDQKSPYTGAHSRRVPVLTMMLAEAVHDEESGVFKDFRLTDADRYELEIAAWLHDCGKITTPEYVMDKSTKLQTIFDRISLIETRFEVLKRDAEITLLQHKIASLEQGKLADPQAQLVFDRTTADLEQHLAFLRRVNVGGESMSSEDIQRVREIGAIPIGFQGEPQPLLSEDEVYNLTIANGTLTKEERQVINNHIVATISMLGSINFPPHLQRVPEYAGGHHERMDGKGYPKGLVREQLSVQARIMGIADIFEALMDSSRPYKKGKKLSEALAILQRMKEGGHIDPDIYQIFIEKEVYLRYAEQYVDPDQVDFPSSCNPA